jgi:plasmid stabilization system protein ParE
MFYAPRAKADLERVADFLLLNDPAAALRTGELIMRGIETPAEHPLIGRPVEQGLRELVVSRGRTGYVVLYRFDLANRRVLVLAIRHQRELDQAN